MTDPSDEHSSQARRPSFSLDSLVGQTLDERYAVDELVGLGAMGAVFRARHTRLRRTVALKVPRPELCSRPDFLGRFEREALTMAKMVHENIVQVFDVFISDDPAKPSYIVMEFVEGIEFEKFLLTQDKSLTVSAVMDLFRQIARGLDAAHERHIIHRDIKPKNIIITMPQRVAKIMDFGVAKLEMENVFETHEASAIGTPAFMAPEQVAGSSITLAADAYGFAMTIYYTLTRKLPFDARSASAFLYAQVSSDPVPAHKRNPLLPAEVHKALSPALSKKPEDRPTSMLSLAEGVARALRPVANRSFGDLFRDGETYPPQGSEMTTIIPISLRNLGFHQVGPRRTLGAGILALLLILVLAFGKGCHRRRTVASMDRAPAASAPEGSSSVTPPPLFPAASNPVVPAEIDALTSRPLAMATNHADETTSTALATGMTLAEASATSSSLMLATATPIMSNTPTTTPKPTSKPKRTETEKKPSPAKTVAGAETSRWDAQATPPLKDRGEREGVKRAIENFFDARIEKPCYRGQFDAEGNALVKLGGSTADELIERIKKLRRTNGNVSVSFQIREESRFWADRAEVKLDLRVEGHPENYPDPNFRKLLLIPPQPLTARLQKVGDSWQLIGFNGPLAID